MPISFYGITITNVLIFLGNITNGDIDISQSANPLAVVYYEFTALEPGKPVIVLLTGAEVVA